MTQITDISRINVEIGGRPIAQIAAQALGAVHVQQRLSAPAQCELVFFDPLENFDNASPMRPGEALRVVVKDQEPELFSGEVTAIEYGYEPGAGRQVRVRAYDPLHRLRKRQPVRAHVQVTFADLAREIAGNLGLRVEAAEDSPVWKRVIQHRQSDLDLLIEIAERSGLHFAARGTSLHIFSLKGIGRPVPLALGDSLFEARIEINSNHACRTVSAKGWDPWHAEARSGQARRARTGRSGAAEATANRMGNAGERTLADLVAQDDRQAEAFAQAELDLCAAREVTLWGVAEGDARLRPGAPIVVEGVAAPVTGQYVLTSVNHTIDAHRGFISEISTVPPSPRRKPDVPSAGALAVLGIVTKIDDPEKLGRVQVSLPAFGDVETDWMEVLSAGGGSGKGLLMIPDVGDRVLALCAHGDPAQGVVLGGLFGPKGLPDDVFGGGGVRRFTMCSPGGQTIRLDDSDKSIRLENKDGSFVELLPSKVKLHAEADLEIEAPGKTIVIRGARVDFQTG
ncbi:MAG TPA: phage baseplate assembly protein V [Blastocatellia bacterium]|nr:phage baseplate assembly protein V [Blastocatellia bacterium]